MGTLNVGRVNASTLDAAAALNFPSYTTGNRPSTGIDTGATIYNSTDETLETWNGSEWLKIGGGSADATLVSHTHNLFYNHGSFGGSSGAVTPRGTNTPTTPGISGRV